jgi:hypothetical protein
MRKITNRNKENSRRIEGLNGVFHRNVGKLLPDHTQLWERQISTWRLPAVIVSPCLCEERVWILIFTCSWDALALRWSLLKLKEQPKNNEARLHQHTNVEAIQLLGSSRAVRRLKRLKPFELVFIYLFGLWGYWHCGHSWPIVPASGDSEDDCGEADGM